MEKLQLLSGLIFCTLVYNAGQLFFALKSKIAHRHYFLGFGVKGVDFKINGVKFTLGFYIPIFPFARIYKIDDGAKLRASMPWEFHHNPLSKRWFVTFGGTCAMLMTGILITIVTTYFDVEHYISKEEVNKWGIYPSKLAQKAGFERGDKILSLNGENYESFNQLMHLKAGATYQISRNGSLFELTIDRKTIDLLYEEPKGLFLFLSTPFEVESVLPDSPAEKAGLRKGDRIRAVNNVPVFKHFELRDELLKDDDGEADLKIARAISDSISILEMKVRAKPDGTIGFIVNENIFYSQKENSFVEAVIKGVGKSWRSVVYNANSFIMIHSENKYKTITTSPVIGKVYIEGIDWHKFFALTGYLLLNFAFLTLLPLPRAAFWEIIPLVYEGIIRKPLHFNVFRTISMISYMIFACFILFNLINDLIRNLS